MTPKRERWTEADVLALPAGEHDYFERKSGLVVADTEKLKGTLAKAVSAFANSGGGHLVLGVDDTGAVDGVPPLRGSTPTREWLEQTIPNLVSYALSDFRVHEVEPARRTSAIPSGRVLLVVDVGDSSLAPHQSDFGGGGATRGVYYYRQAGHSVPAPHFYLELVRQRLTSPVLTAALGETSVWYAIRREHGIFAALDLTVRVVNDGRVAAYKWGVQARWKPPDDRAEDYIFDLAEFPDRPGRPSGLSLDQTLLPGAETATQWTFGVQLRPKRSNLPSTRAEFRRLLGSLEVEYRVATETSLGEYRVSRVLDAAAPERLAMHALQQAFQAEVSEWQPQ